MDSPLDIPSLVRYYLSTEYNEEEIERMLKTAKIEYDKVVSHDIKIIYDNGVVECVEIVWTPYLKQKSITKPQ